MNNYWFVTCRVPGTEQVRVSWNEDGKAHTHVFPSQAMAQGWINTKMGQDKTKAAVTPRITEGRT